MTKLVVVLIALALFGPPAKATDEEITLFNSKGKAAAYIVTDDLTIYLWSGKPVAYLKSDTAKDFHVYGFNGKHLGWLVQGIVRDHDGRAVCAVKDRLKSTEFEPFKAFKEFKPFKAFTEFAPFRPFFSNTFGDRSCAVYLAQGNN
jgi:hypothetical protein